MALIKKNSEVPSYALIFMAKLINSALHEVHAKTYICKIGLSPLHNRSHICYIFQVHKKKKRPLFMVFGQLFHSKQRVTRADLGGGYRGLNPLLR